MGFRSIGRFAGRTRLEEACPIFWLEQMLRYKTPSPFQICYSIVTFTTERFPITTSLPVSQVCPPKSRYIPILVLLIMNLFELHMSSLFHSESTPLPQILAVEVQQIEEDCTSTAQPSQQAATLGNIKTPEHRSREHDTPSSKSTPSKVVCRKEGGSILWVGKREVHEDGLHYGITADHHESHADCGDYPVDFRICCPC